MTGYSPPRRWPERGQGYGDGPPMSRMSEPNHFSDVNYMEEPQINGGVGPPHGYQGPGRYVYKLNRSEAHKYIRNNSQY